MQPPVNPYNVLWRDKDFVKQSCYPAVARSLWQAAQRRKSVGGQQAREADLAGALSGLQAASYAAHVRQ